MAVFPAHRREIKISYREVPNRALPFGALEKMILLTIRKSINWSTHWFRGKRPGKRWTSNIERPTSNEGPVNQTRALLWPLRQWRSDCWMLLWNGKISESSLTCLSLGF